MKKNQGEDFYWLNCVPCWTVKIIGMIVGTQTYEERNPYLGEHYYSIHMLIANLHKRTVDDGTSVIDCIHKCSPGPPPQPQQYSLSSTATAMTKGHGNIKTQTEDPILPKPTVWMGHTVQVTGWIDDLKSKDSWGQRQILVQDIGMSFRHLSPIQSDRVIHMHMYQYPVRCKSINKKLYHWRTVLTTLAPIFYGQKIY